MNDTDILRTIYSYVNIENQCNDCYFLKTEKCAICKDLICCLNIKNCIDCSNKICKSCAINCEYCKTEMYCELCSSICYNLCSGYFCKNCTKKCIRCNSIICLECNNNMNCEYCIDKL